MGQPKFKVYDFVQDTDGEKWVITHIYPRGSEEVRYHCERLSSSTCTMEALPQWISLHTPTLEEAKVWYNRKMERLQHRKSRLTDELEKIEADMTDMAGAINAVV